MITIISINLLTMHSGIMNIFAQVFLFAQNAGETPKDSTGTWFLNPNFLIFLAVLLSIPLCIFIGRTLAKRFRLPEVGWKISLILFCLITSGLVYYGKSAEMSRDTNGLNSIPFKFGVDLRGGVTIIGQLNEQKVLPGEERITIQQIIPQLKQRIDPSGVREIVIRALGNDKMEVIIPDVEKEEAERIWERLITAGQLLFRIVADEANDGEMFRIARATTYNRDREVFSAPDDENPNGKKLGEWFLLAREQPKDRNSKQLLPFKFLPQGDHLVRNAQTGEIIDVTAIPFDRSNLAQGRFQFNEWLKDRDITDVEILMVHPREDRFNVEGKYLTSVRKGFDANANLRIEFSMDALGGKRMWALTSTNQKNGDRYRLLGIVLDEQLQAAPRINDPIRSNGVIEGSFTEDEISGYIAVLNSGKLDVALRKNWISMDQILSQLGEELKKKGLFAIGISLVIVLVFMMFYYRFCGFAACAALTLNLIFTLSILLLINVNLTLTGLAGLVLTIGMSVDANILIFERIREELRRGSALRMAIRNGFDRATTTIVDANLTTLITAVILYVIGSEQLRSFSVTLIVGILMCMFTSIFCSRVFFDIAERRRWITDLRMRSVIGSTLLDFIGKRRIAFVVSILVIGIGLAALLYRGSGMLDTDIAGGSTARIEFVQPTTAEDVKAELEAGDFDHLGDPIRYSVTQMADNANAFMVDSSLPVIEDENAVSQQKLDEIIAEVFKDKLVMLNMDYDPNLIRVTKLERSGRQTPGLDNPGESPPAGIQNKDDGNIGTGNPPVEDPKSADPQTNDGQENNQQLSLSPMSISPAMASGLNTSLLMIQDESKGEVKQDEQKGNEAKQDEQQTGQVETSPPDDDGLLAPQENELNANQAQIPGLVDKYAVKTRLEFAHPITGISVKNYLIDAARDRGNRMRAQDISVSTDDEKKDEGDRDRFWDLEILVVNPDDAKVILADVKAKMAGQPYFASSSGVGSQVAGQTQQKALFAMIASLIGIVAYVWIRFQNVAFGLAAIVALVHDVLVVLGAIAISYWLSGAFGFLLVQDFRISLSVVAALLTIIGYSLNDTIVVFDRIREVRGKRADITAEIINKSISQTLSRTILTSLTTLLVVSILYVIGGDAIHAFAFALVIGVMVGTYSSIFVASPVLLWLMNRGVSVAEPEKA